MLEAARKTAVKTIGVPVAKVLDLLGFNSKELYELAYWKVRKWREPVLTNDHYEPLFTKWIGVDREHYDNKAILDIGCGPRGSLEWADNARERVGLDSLVNSYRKLGIEAHAMTYVHAGAESIPFEDAHFDIVTSFNSLDHVEDVASVVHEIHRVLAPNGEFIVVVEIHAKPTIAEPHVLSWNFLDEFRELFEFRNEEYLDFNPQFGGASAALQSRIPVADRTGDGVVFAIARKRN
ncbi:class I SAM-dependent methyltransferase [Granulosicoccus sp.]|nr:class I SAM-dependent methyltransferase [Granulosicoccus sp.]